MPQIQPVEPTDARVALNCTFVKYIYSSIFTLVVYFSADALNYTCFICGSESD